MELPAVTPGPEELRACGLPGPDDPAAYRAVELHPGEICPACGSAPLDFNGLLHLACPACGYSLGGGFT